MFFGKKKNPFSAQINKDIAEIKAMSREYEQTRQQLLVSLAKIKEVTKAKGA